MVGTITQPEWIYICTDALGGSPPPRESRRRNRRKLVKTFILVRCGDTVARPWIISPGWRPTCGKRGPAGGGECVYGREEAYRNHSQNGVIQVCRSGAGCFREGGAALAESGDTFAHAIEKNCPIMHGEAVAIGLVLARGIRTAGTRPGGTGGRSGGGFEEGRASAPSRP